MPIQTKQSSPSLADNALRLPTEFPRLPGEVVDRFATIERWEGEVRSFFQKYESAVRDFAGAVQDTNELGGILIADPQTGAVYIHPSRGPGSYADAATPFFINREGFFSLGNSLTWDPNEKVLTIIGEIIATSGEIGGFDIGSDYIRDSANSFGLSSTVSGGNDVRFWAGSTFANRAIAPFRVYENGAIFADGGTVGGFTLFADRMEAGAGATRILLDAANAVIIMGVVGTSDYASYASNIIELTYTSGVTRFSVLNSADLYLNKDNATDGIRISATGSKIYFGQAQDTNLYTPAADTLKTDDEFIAVGSITGANLTVAAGGVLKVGNANTPIADTPVIGYINITDSAGAVKRVAVV